MLRVTVATVVEVVAIAAVAMVVEEVVVVPVVAVRGRDGGCEGSTASVVTTIPLPDGRRHLARSQPDSLLRAPSFGIPALEETTGDRLLFKWCQW